MSGNDDRARNVKDENEGDALAPLVERAQTLGASPFEIDAARTLGGLGPLIIDLALRPPGPVVSIDQYAAGTANDERAGLARRLWRAFGLPQDDVLLPVTPDMAAGLDLLLDLSELLGENAVVAFARVIGSTALRLAEALASMARLGMEVPELEAGRPYAEVANDYITLAVNLLPRLWDTTGAVFRRHLMRHAYGTWSTDEERVAVTVERTVGFADLVGSTDHMQSLSVAALANEIDVFEQDVWDRVTQAGGRVVKLIGDEAMFIFDHPPSAVDVAVALISDKGASIRAGIAHGFVAARHGDYYGPTVNLAARLVAAAPAGTILVSDSVATALSDDRVKRFETEPLRGFPSGTPVWRVH